MVGSRGVAAMLAGQGAADRWDVIVVLDLVLQNAVILERFLLFDHSFRDS